MEQQEANEEEKAIEEKKATEKKKATKKRNVAEEKGAIMEKRVTRSCLAKEAPDSSVVVGTIKKSSMPRIEEVMRFLELHKAAKIVIVVDTHCRDNGVESHDGGRRAEITLMPSLPNMHYKKFPHLLHILVWLTQPHATSMGLSSGANHTNVIEVNGPGLNGFYDLFDL